VSVLIEAIEVQRNREWATYSEVPPPPFLYFTNNQRSEYWLFPHAAGFGSLLAEPVIPPTNAAWRARASVAEKLADAEDVVAAIIREPTMLRIRQATGNTNIPVNPFRKDVSRFGQSWRVVSDAVAPQ
jgi:hypothetical protein